jgi:hypothetical protein
VTQAVDLSQLATEILRLKARRNGLNIMIADLEQDLVQRMRINHQVVHEDGKVKVKISQRKKGCPVTFKQEFGELDMLTKQQFDEIYTEAKEVVVKKDATVNLTKLNKLKNYGDEIWDKADHCIIKDTWRIDKIYEMESE